MATADRQKQQPETGDAQRPITRTITPANSTSSTLQSSLPPHLVGTAGLSKGDELTMVICEKGVFIPYEQ